MTFCLTPKEFSKSVNASPNASFVLSTWMLKSPTIRALSTLTNRSERKSANSFRKSVYSPGGLYTVARARDRIGFFCIYDSVTLSRSILNELNLYPVFWVTLRISLYINSPLVEFMIIKCRPFYLPREYTAILLVAVYIPPSSNNINRSEALNDLYQHISEQQTAHPDAFLILAGNFNHADLKSVFPKIYQHVDFPTRGKNTLDFVYTTQRGAYKALPLPHLGASDHITVMLMPAYRPLVKVIKPIHKKIQVWPEGSSEALQDCFDTTDWNMFKQAATYNNTTDLQEYTETVTAYITKCIDDVTVTKTITVRANQKPWLTGRSTDCWRLGTLPLELEMRRAWRQLGPTYPAASERPRDSTPGG